MATSQDAFSALLTMLSKQLGPSGPTSTQEALASLHTLKVLQENARRQGVCAHVSKSMSAENDIEGLCKLAAQGLANAFRLGTDYVHVYLSASPGGALHDVATEDGLTSYLSALSAYRSTLANAHALTRESSAGEGSDVVLASPNVGDDVDGTAAPSLPSVDLTAPLPPIPEVVSGAAAMPLPTPAAELPVSVSPAEVAPAASPSTTQAATPAASGHSTAVPHSRPPPIPMQNRQVSAENAVGLPPVRAPTLAHATSTTGTVLASGTTDEQGALPHIALRRISHNVSGQTSTTSPQLASARRSSSAVSAMSGDAVGTADAAAAMAAAQTRLVAEVMNGDGFSPRDLAERVMTSGCHLALVKHQAQPAQAGPHESPVPAPAPASSVPVVPALQHPSSRPTTPSTVLPALHTTGRRSVAGQSAPVLPALSPQPATSARLVRPPAAADPHLASTVSLLSASESASSIMGAAAALLPPIAGAQAQGPTPEPEQPPRLVQKQSSGFSQATLVPDADATCLLSPTGSLAESITSMAARSELSPAGGRSARVLPSSGQLFAFSSGGSPDAHLRSADTKSPVDWATGPLPAVAVAVPMSRIDGDGSAVGAVVLRCQGAGGSQHLCLSSLDAELVDMIATALAAGQQRVMAMEDARAAEKRAYGLVEMVKAVSHEVEVPAIIVRIIDVAYDLLAADRVSVFRVDAERKELVLSVSEDAAGLRLPMDKGIVGRVASTGTLLNIADAYDNPLFDRTFDQRTNYRTKSVLCMPVKAPGGEVVAVIQAINKAGGLPFTAEDERTLSVVTDTAGVTLHKAKLLADTEMARRASAALADVVRIVNDSEGSENENVEALINSLVQVAYQVVDADRVTLFLVDAMKQELFCQVSQDAESLRRLRIPLGKGIAGTVAANGSIVNIADAYADDRFNRDMDARSGYKTRSILCMPLKLRQSGRVVGVVQAINKRGGPFTRADEELLEAWSTEVGLVIDRKSLQLAYDKVLADEMSAGDGEAGKLSSFLTQFVKVPGAGGPRTTRGSALGGAVGFAAGVNSSRKLSGSTTPHGIPSAASLLSFTSARMSGNVPERTLSHRTLGSAVASPKPSVAGSAHATTTSSPGPSSSPSQLPPSGSSAPPVVVVPVPIATGEAAPSSPNPHTAVPAGSTGAGLSDAVAESPAADNDATTAREASGSGNTPVEPAPGGETVEAPSPAPAEASTAASAPSTPVPAPAPLREPSPVTEVLTDADAETALMRPWMLQVPRPGRESIAKQMTEWTFDVLDYDDMALTQVMMDMLHHFNLFQQFRLDAGRLHTFFDDVRTHYRPNPYHNFKHGVSVAHICFLGLHHTAAAASVLSPLDRLATLLAAVCHDVDHTGVTNAYEMNALTDFAVLYNDQSVLENHHAALMFQLLHSQDVYMRTRAVSDFVDSPPAGYRRLSVGSAGSSGTGSTTRPEHSTVVQEQCVSILGLSRADFMNFRRTAIAGILATDMTHHNALTDQARRITPETSLEMSSKTLTELLVHSADLSNPVLPNFPTVYKWTMMVCSEFTAQVEREKAAGLPFAPHMDGLTSLQAIAKLQVGFIGYVVSPLWISMAAAFPELQCTVDNMGRNRTMWQAIVDGTATAPDVVVPVPEGVQASQPAPEAAATEPEPHAPPQAATPELSAATANVIVPPMNALEEAAPSPTAAPDGSVVAIAGDPAAGAAATS